MDIKSGQPESHPTPLPLDASHSPGVVAPTPRFPSGTGTGGVLSDISGVDFTGEASAAMAAGMSADAGRRAGYVSGVAAEMVIPDVPANAVPPAASFEYPFSGMEPTPAAAGTDGIYPAA